MSLTLTAVKRAEKGTKTRLEGKLPAVVYGAEKESESVALTTAEFEKLYRQAGESTLLDLVLDGKDAGKVIVQDVQLDPVKGRVIHVDLRRINMNKAMTAPVELRFVGEAPVVKEQGGTLVTTIKTVEVKCLPKDLVSFIEVNLGTLKTYDDVLKIKDITLPTGITIVSPNAEDLVAKAARALTEEEIKKMEEEGAQMDVSKIESAKPVVAEEGEEAAADGAAPKAAAPKEEKK